MKNETTSPPQAQDLGTQKSNNPTTSYLRVITNHKDIDLEVNKQIGSKGKLISKGRQPYSNSWELEYQMYIVGAPLHNLVRCIGDMKGVLGQSIKTVN